MITFQEILEQNGIEFVDSLMNNYLVVYEKKNCSVLSFMRCDEELKFFKGNDKEEITPLNYALHNYFEEGINYIRRASSIFFREFPEKWLFKLNYYPTVNSDVNPVGTNAELLELSAIVSDSGSVIKEDAMLSSWAERLGVGFVKPVFSGYLNEFQKSKLYAYLKEPVLNSQVPFSAYIMGILNPSQQADNAEGYYFNFYKNGSKKATALKLIDPMVAALAKKSKESSTKASNTSELVLLNFVCWLKNIDLNKYKVEGGDNDARYLDLVCKLFNDYIEEESAIYKSYIKESYSVINLDKISNEKTRELLREHPQYQEPFQIIAGSFKSRKDTDYVNPTSLMNSDIIDSFNNEVERIAQKVSLPEVKPVVANPSKEQKPQKEEKFLTFIDFISQDKDSDYVKSMEQEKAGDKKAGAAKSEDKGADEKKPSEDKKADASDKKDDKKSNKAEETDKGDNKKETDNTTEKDKEDKKVKDKKDSKEDESEEKKDGKKSNEKDGKPEEDSADEKGNGEEKTDKGSESDKSNDSGDADDGSDDGGSDEDTSDSGKETPKNDKKNDKKKDKGDSSFKL